MKRICLYNILPLLCSFLFLACEKEEAGNGGTGIDDPPPITNSNDDITSLIQPQQTSVTFPYQKTDVIGNDLERYTVEGTGDVTLRSSIYPFYAFEKSNIVAKDNKGCREFTCDYLRRGTIKGMLDL